MRKLYKQIYYSDGGYYYVDKDDIQFGEDKAVIISDGYYWHDYRNNNLVYGIEIKKY